jgi:hypothetical protein
VRRLLSLGLLLWLASSVSAAELHVWVDEAGRTHVTDDPAKIPPAHEQQATHRALEIRGLWGEELRGPPVGDATSPDAEGARVRRILRGALDDLARGETARAQVSLEAVLRLEPARPEAHWYLALLDWQRGRLDVSERHLRAFLAASGDEFGPWQESARQRLARLDDERRLLAPAEGELRLIAHRSEHFRLQVDAALQEGGAPDFAARVLGYLEEARRDLGIRLGVVPAEPTGVVLYGKAAYLRAHRHRFSFQTVGFYDGRIHVVSAAHPAGELRSLLYHEYTHALFREATGGDRPFWLNEGLAEDAERASRGGASLTRTERAQLRSALDANAWIPLRRLGPGFAGLSHDEATLAYLEATAAAGWLARHSDAAARRRLLEGLGQGKSVDRALSESVGASTDALESALQGDLRAQFPSASPASAR